MDCMIYFFPLIKNNKGRRMKQLLFSGLLGLAMLALTGCGEDKKPETPVMKCEAGKCGTAMEKTEVPTQKCTADAKCGEGKCGDN